MSQDFPPQLKAAGAGVPPVERLLLQISFTLFVRSMSMRKLRLKLAKEQRLISGILAPIADEKRVIRVLIPRIFGIEDSSRFWSVNMTLHHIIIVNDAILGLRERLLSGQPGLKPVSIADVKPPIESPNDIATLFSRSLTTLESALQGEKIQQSSATHRHPWFGELDAFKWLCLAVLHVGIHRRQLGFSRALSEK